ncbi:MAG: M50 family metallopeptidase [Anaerolineales bacterium]|nr:M50 family metallopeptidase [Anaerolineales bacterium]
MPDLLVFVLILAALILGHELGHFVAARARGVRVDEFGIGFPPRLATLFQAGGTRFTLNAIPLGGFVRPAGEDDPNFPGGLASASKRTRAIVLLAGPLANILIALLAFSAAYRFAAPDFERTSITTVADSSPAQAAGLLPGDVIIEFQGQPVTSLDTLQRAIAGSLGRTATITVERAERQLKFELTPRLTPPEGQGPIGIVTGNPRRAVSWPEAAGLGIESIRLQLREIVHLPGRLIQGQVAPEEARLTGLKGMHDMLAWARDVDRSAQRPFLTLTLVGVISTGLALANLLPIPALDGGRLMFVAFEAIFGRRLSPRYEGLAHAIGFAFLLALMLYVNIQDFVNPIALPR